VPLTKLKEKAVQAILRADYVSARNYFHEMHQQAPSDIRVFIKLAEMKQRTGDYDGAIADYIQIASNYAENGFVVQAIGINKIILRLDPYSEKINQKLQCLSSERGEQWATASEELDLFEEPSETAYWLEDTQPQPSLMPTPLLSELSGEELNAFMDSLELKEFSAQQTIYRQGEKGEFLYLISKGSVCLQTMLESGEKSVYCHFHAGDFFGEYAFMSHLNHRNTAVTETDSSILMIERTTFEQWVTKYPQILDTVESFYRQRVLAWVLAVTPLFEGVPLNVRKALAEKFNVRHFHQGDIIVEQGAKGDTFYLIRSGCVNVTTMNRVNDVDRDVELAQLKAGSFFGEVSLLTNRPRTATIIANDDVELMELTREDFNMIAKHFPSVRKMVETYLKQRVKETIEVLVTRS